MVPAFVTPHAPVVDISLPPLSLCVPSQLSVLAQWRDEIVKFTSPGSVSVLVHYGDRRAVSVQVGHSGS